MRILHTMLRVGDLEKHGTTEISFVEYPDGYRIELIQMRAR